MPIILVADIFGKTPALIELSKALNAAGIVDPYNGMEMGFTNEAAAYAYFVDNVGFSAYLSELLKVTESLPSDCTLIGFSIGASVIWKLSENRSVNSVKRGICYYGSQIRNFTAVNPLFEVELIFPQSEPHFDVLAVQAELAKKPNVKTMQVPYLHGFMNFYSTNYSQTAYTEQLNWLRENIS